jgi:hypothetical protein
LKVGQYSSEYFVSLVDEKLPKKVLVYQGQLADGIDNPNSKFEYSTGQIQNQEFKIQKNYSDNKLVQISYEFKINDQYLIISFIEMNAEILHIQIYKL